MNQVFIQELGDSVEGPFFNFHKKHGAQGELSELLYLVISPLNF